jgi:hypothetical protein
MGVDLLGEGLLGCGCFCGHVVCRGAVGVWYGVVKSI